jgi:hypothetical protein
MSESLTKRDVAPGLVAAFTELEGAEKNLSEEDSTHQG